MEEKTKAIIYARFSPRPNTDESDSAEFQVSKCRSYCDANDYVVVGVYKDEGLSGGSSDRPGFQEAVAHACREKAVLVVYSLSRFARNTQDALHYSETLRLCGANLASLTEKLDTHSPMGRFIFVVFAALASLEREVTSQRTSDAMHAHQANGRRMSRYAPYGKRIVGDKLVDEPSELEIIDKIMDMHQAGKRPREIARLLVEANIPCRGNRWWYHTTVDNIINRTNSSEGHDLIG